MFSITKIFTMKKIYCVICGKYRNLKILKYHTLLKKTVLFIIYSKFENENEKIFKEVESIVILKAISLIKNV